MRDGIAEATESAANIRGLASVHERYGGLGARISPAAQAEIAPRLVVARGMVATLGNTGVINPGEVPTINGALPNPGDLAGWTFQTFNQRMATWNSILESKVRARLASRGVDDAGIDRVLSTIRTGSWSQGGGQGQPTRQARGSAPSDTVVVTNGTRRISLPRAQYERRRAEIEADGYQVEE